MNRIRRIVLATIVALGVLAVTPAADAEVVCRTCALEAAEAAGLDITDPFNIARIETIYRSTDETSAFHVYSTRNGGDTTRYYQDGYTYTRSFVSAGWVYNGRTFVYTYKFKVDKSAYAFRF